MQRTNRIVTHTDGDAAIDQMLRSISKIDANPLTVAPVKTNKLQVMGTTKEEKSVFQRNNNQRGGR